MSNIIKCLEKLNKKERHHLVLRVIGKTTLPLSDEFRNALGYEIGEKIPPSGFTIFIDYQLNWIEKCLYPVKVSTGRETVRDIDLLIAFETDNVCHLVMVEAKGPKSSWDNDQMSEKALALKTLFGKGKKGNKVRGVMAHFCLISPNRPQNLKTEEWPKWMKKSNDDPYFWIPLNSPQ